MPDSAPTSGDGDTSGASLNFARWLWGIAAITLIWQIIFILVWRRDYDPWGDAYFFHRAGMYLADGLGWISPADYDFNNEIVQAADHPPLYILFLAFWSWIGLQGVLVQMILTSVFFGVPVVLVSGLAGREIGGKRLGIIAAVVAAVYPPIWVWQGTLLSEPTAMLGLVSLVYVVYRFHHRPTMALAAGMGAVLAFATFGRAELLLLSVIVVTPMILRTRAWSLGRRVGALVIAGAVCAVSLAPWVLFNLSRFEEPVYLSAGYEITLATANCDDTYYGTGTGFWSLDCVLDIYDRAGISRTADQSERSALLFEETTEYIGDHLDRLPTVVLARWMRFGGLWMPIEDAALEAFLYDRDPWTTKIAAMAFYPMAIAAAAGAVILRRRGETILPLVGPIVVVFVTITITFAQNRYRASVEPAIALLAAVTIERLWTGMRALLDDPEDRDADVEVRADQQV